jgi:hypothetical protein
MEALMCPSNRAFLVRAIVRYGSAYLVFWAAWNWILATVLGYSDISIGDGFIPFLADGFVPVAIGQSAAVAVDWALSSGQHLRGRRAAIVWLLGQALVVVFVVVTVNLPAEDEWTRVRLQTPLSMSLADGTLADGPVLPAGTQLAARPLAPASADTFLVVVRESRPWWDPGPPRTWITHEASLVDAVLGIEVGAAHNGPREATSASRA